MFSTQRPMKRVLLLFTLVTTFYAAAFSQTRLNLTNGWQFRKANSTDEWIQATVPGTVISDLENAGVIPNPFVGCNHENIKWIEETVWEYALEFTVPDHLENCHSAQLVFEGLDTYADVYLNGSKLLTANNMFRTWRADVTKRLVTGKNALTIVFRPVNELIRKQKEETGIELPGGEWAYIRKAAFQFGWDFAPRMVNCGIWQPVYLQSKFETNLNNASIVTKTANENEATLTASFQVSSEVEKKGIVTILNAIDWQPIHQEEVGVKKGNNQFDVDFSILKPILWWPNGMGGQHLYALAMVFETETEPQQIVNQKVGIRTVELIAEPDGIGTSFLFRVNGKPMFAKGANIVPPHSYKFYEEEKWTNLVTNAHLTNMNMLRVWGGGLYPPKSFYNACDSLGILVWSDFMFACSMYPWDESFTENVRREAVEQVRKINGHASVALWCGNNEIDEGWHNWGWQKQLADSLVIDTTWKGYQKIFHNLLAEVVKQNDPTRAYWSSSPLYGWGSDESMKHGDSHYWGVWWGKETFERYRFKVPRFMSEYGFQGFPNRSSLEIYSGEKGITDKFLQCHQKHPEGFQIIDQYIRREKLKYSSIDQRVYVSQIVQAIGYQTAIEAHRVAMPKCMGSLYWQLNDCWPAVSWSGIDVNNQWKAVQYQAKRSFAPVIVVPEFRGSKIVVNLVNDTPNEIEGDVSVQVVTPTGRKLGVWKNYVTLEPQSTSRVVDEKLFDDPLQNVPMVAIAQFSKEFKNFIYGYSFNEKWGSIELKDPKVAFTIAKIEGETYIDVTTKNPAFFVEMYSTNGELLLSDNFFHIFPDTKQRVKLLKGNPEVLAIRSLWNMRD